MKLYLVRHGQPDVAPGICYGRSDVMVAEHEMLRVAAGLASRLPADVPVWTSPASRCRGLAERLRRRAGARVGVDSRLREMDFGDWEMRAWNEIARAQIDAWAEDLLHYRPGGGECVLEAAVRVASFHADLLAAGTEAAVLVCHAGTMRLLAHLHGGLTVAQSARAAASQPHRIEYGELLVLG